MHVRLYAYFGIPRSKKNYSKAEQRRAKREVEAAKRPSKLEKWKSRESMHSIASAEYQYIYNREIIHYTGFFFTYSCYNGFFYFLSVITDFLESFQSCLLSMVREKKEFKGLGIEFFGVSKTRCNTDQKKSKGQGIEFFFLKVGVSKTRCNTDRKKLKGLGIEFFFF